MREVLVQGETVAMFGSFTYRGRASGKDVTSPFSLLAHVKGDKVSYIQFLEDSFGTAGTVSPSAE